MSILLFCSMVWAEEASPPPAPVDEPKEEVAPVDEPKEEVAPVDETPPDAPSGLTAISGDTQVGLSWKPSKAKDLAGYTIYRATKKGGPYAKVNPELVKTTKYVDKGLTNGTTYYYVVTASDKAKNESPYSSECSALPADKKPPNEVTNFTITAGDKELILSWVNPKDGDLAGVKLIRKEGSFPKDLGDGVKVYNGKETVYKDKGLSNGTKCYYTIFTYDEVPNYSKASQTKGIPLGDTNIYYGDTKGNKKAASILMQEILKASPSYRVIMRRKLTPDRGKYWLLIGKASRRIRGTLEKVAKEEGYDLIVEAGYMFEAPDITEQVVEMLKER